MQLFPLKLVPDNTKIDFVGTRWYGFIFSLLAVLVTFWMVYDNQLDMGIDFTGGVMIEIRTEKSADLAELRKALSVPELGEVSLQSFGDDREVLIRFETSENEEQAKLVEHAKDLIESVEGQVEYRQIDYVGPTVGAELIEAGFWSLAVALAAMMVYIWFRFEWQFGFGAILSLIHDAILVVGFYAVTGFDFGLTSIAAVLTVVGYSINDSVVIYDRVRENMRKYKKMPFDELLNKSLNETLSRTVVTGITTILAALALAIFGGEVLEGFSYALAIGVVIGTYSSIYLSAPILLYLGMRNQKRQDEAATA